MVLEFHEKNPDRRKLKKISDSLKEGEVYICPTDTVYSIIADSHSKTGVERLYTIKKIPKNQPLSLLCNSIEMASSIVETMPNTVFKIMKKLTPGPYTFILKANKLLPKPSFLHQKEKQIGIRIPNQKILLDLIEIHDSPLTATSASVTDDFYIEMDDLEETYGKLVEGIIDGGIQSIELSTILDCISDPIQILREGKGIDQLQALIQS